MRIADVRVRILKAPITEPIRMSFSSLRCRQMALVEIEADDGTVGYGESWVNYPPWAGIERAATIRHGIAPLLVGEECDSIRRLVGMLHAKLNGFARQWGAKGPIWQAISGIEIGLWDLVGKARQVPLYELLGGATRDRIPLYASGLDGDNILDLGKKYLDDGFAGFKLRVGFNHQDDLAAMRQASELLRNSSHLYVDANQAWSLQAALSLLENVRDLGLSWIEEPIIGSPIDALEELYRQVAIPVAIGENLYGVREFLPYLRSHAVAAVQPDVSKVGGISEMMSICSLGEAYGKPVVPHWYGGAIALAATLHVAAAHPAIELVEFDVRANPFRDDVITEAFEPINGSVTIPNRPGLGVNLNDSALREYEDIDCE